MDVFTCLNFCHFFTSNYTYKEEVLHGWRTTDLQFNLAQSLIILDFKHYICWAKTNKFVLKLLN